MDDFAQLTWRRIGRLALGCVAAVVVLLVGAAHGLARAGAHNISVFPALPTAHMEALLIPGSADASAWLQRLVPEHIGVPVATQLWWSWFYLPVVLCAVVMAVLGPRHFARLLFLFAATLFVADIIFALVPSLPPWMADGTPRLIAGTTGSVTSLDTNPTAAFPSLHVAVPFVFALWFWHHERPGCRLAGRLLMLRTLLVFWAVVYTGEHFVIDGVGAIALGGGVYLALDRFGLAQERGITAARTPVDITQHRHQPLPAADDDDHEHAAVA